MTKQRYLLALEAAGQRDDAATVRKLRALLKRLGRVYGFRCVRVEEQHVAERLARTAGFVKESLSVKPALPSGRRATGLEKDPAMRRK